MMNPEKLEHLGEGIRHSLEEECAVRNSRTNWFMVFQVALGGGVLQVLLNQAKCSIPYHAVISVVSFVGAISSVCFWYAGWRSEKAVDMLLAFWDELRSENRLEISAFYPVIPLTEGIIKNYFANCYNEAFEDSVWEHKLANRMRLHQKDRWINKLDYLMPYKLIPKLFAYLWTIICLTFLSLWAFAK